MARTLASMVVLLPLLVGTSRRCPEPNYPTVEDCPFPVDPNLVVGKLLGWVRLEAGQPLVHTRRWCDPDGDPARVKVLQGPEGLELINRPKTASYTLLWTPRHPMTTAIVLRVTDEPTLARPKSDTGTLLVQVLPRRKRFAPGLCGGPSQ
ncbi:MAG: hypothetical protein JW741_30520 [Sedimentisphaerales bacterium]|nr:hypothetical protein [Sedimentisphaerales bacterium]